MNRTILTTIMALSMTVQLQAQEYNYVQDTSHPKRPMRVHMVTDTKEKAESYVRTHQLDSICDVYTSVESPKEYRVICRQEIVRSESI